MDMGKIAKLAQLSLSEDEQATMKRELGNIFQWIDALKAIEGQEECIPTQPVMHERQDCTEPTPPIDSLLANAPEQAYGMFSVPKVVETV